MKDPHLLDLSGLDVESLPCCAYSAAARHIDPTRDALAAAAEHPQNPIRTVN